MNSEESPGADANGTPLTSARSANRAADVARNIARGLKGLAPVGVHPALIPGVGVEQTQRTYRFFCHVLHQNHVAKQGVDTAELKRQMTKLLEDRGAAIPAEHNYGRLYEAPPALVEHYKRLDPCNVFNAGVGKTSPRKNWSQ